MKKIVLFLLTTFVLSCDDGNVDIPEFDFSNATINDCENLLLFKIDGNESLIIELNQDNTDDAFFTQVRDNESFSLTESGSNTIVYRTFDDQPTESYFCQNIPPASPLIVNEWAGSGTLLVTTTVTEDDQDNVEETNLTLDSDADTIPDYIDSDDDNDAILTKDEDVDGDNNPANDDTDGDSIPNYLDDDDDGDGVLSIEESITADDDGDSIPDYLDADTTIVQAPRSQLVNNYVETYDSSFVIQLLSLSNANGNSLQFDIFDYGSLTKDKLIP